MLPLTRICIRTCHRILQTSSILQNPSHLISIPLSPLPQSVRHKSTGKRKKKLPPGVQNVEKGSQQRLRLKLKGIKDREIKRKKYERLVAAQKAAFKLPPHEPRPDAIPFGTAMFLLRGWSAKQEIFVRSRAASWTPETKVVAMVRVVPNDHHPRGIKGRVKFPFPVVGGSKESKKERIVAIVEGEQEAAAKQAGMVVGGKEYLEKIVKMVNENQPLPFDILLTTPKGLSMFKPYGRVLGPKGLMPNEKRGTLVEDFSSYTKKEEIGIELKLDGEGKTSNGATLRVVVGKFKQDDHEIEANLKALVQQIHKITGGTQIPLEVSLYSTIPPFLVHQHPHLTIQRQIHVPKPTLDGTPKLQAPSTVYPPDHVNYLSNASVIIPIAEFLSVGHPKGLRPERLVKRYVADAEWAPAQGKEREIAKYKAGIRLLEKKKQVYKWSANRTKEDVRNERMAGFRRSGEVVEGEEAKRLVL